MKSSKIKDELRLTEELYAFHTSYCFKVPCHGRTSIQNRIADLKNVLNEDKTKGVLGR
jgi:hypothetical protein